MMWVSDLDHFAICDWFFGKPRWAGISKDTKNDDDDGRDLPVTNL